MLLQRKIHAETMKLPWDCWSTADLVQARAVWTVALQMSPLMTIHIDQNV